MQAQVSGTNMQKEHSGSRAAVGSLREPAVPLSIVLATLTVNILALALPLTILQVYDRIIPNRSYETLAFLFVGLLVVLVIDFVLRVGRSCLMIWKAAEFVRRTSHDAVVDLLLGPNDEARRQPVATSANRYSAIASLADFHAGPSRLVSIELPFISIGLAIMTIVGGVMVLVPITLFCIFAVLSVRRNKTFRQMIEMRSDQDNRKYDFVTEALSGSLTIKSMAMEPQMLRRFERLQQSVAEFTWRSIILGQSAQCSAVLYGSVSQIMVVAIGGIRVVDDRLSIGALACCTLLSGQILQPLLRTISLWTENQSVGHRRREVAALVQRRESASTPVVRADVHGVVRFENVRFSYNAQSHPVIDGVSFAIPAGAIVGLRGEDGSGRSTVLRLLRGDIFPSAGTVSIDGIATSASSFAGIRARIAYVGSVPQIFAGTILDNLTLFRPERRNSVRRMCHLIGLDVVINRMPDGFDTPLNESATDEVPLSVAQQICIVRALSMDPGIVILDEANASLDRASEAGLIKALQYLKGKRTVILATHRPSLIGMSDILVTLEKGAIRYQDSSQQIPAKGAA